MPGPLGLYAPFPTDCSWCKIGRDRLTEFTTSVHTVYETVFGSRHGWVADEEDMRKMIAEDENFSPDSAFLAVTCASNRILGTIRLTRWKPGMTLPIEYEFGLNVAEYQASISPKPKEVWHAGRLSIDKVKLAQINAPRSLSYKILRNMTLLSVNLVSPDETVIVLGEADEMAVRIYRNIGVEVEAIGESVEYLGSKTVPVMIRSTAFSKASWISSGLKQAASF